VGELGAGAVGVLAGDPVMEDAGILAGVPPPKLRVEDVAVEYGSTPALAGLDLAVGEGEFVSLLGPSGCGKTTLLRVIAGLLRPKRGRVFLDGRDITELAPEKRPLNMVFQHLALFPHLSVGDNVGFGLSLAKVPRTEIGRRVPEMLELVGLGGYGDEPLGALDFAIRKEMQGELKSLQRRLNITFVFVTHDQSEAMAMSDRVVLMREGVILQDATPFETYTNPANPFAAGFVGETNLVEGRVVASSGAGSVVGFPGDVKLSTRSTVRSGAPVAVSVRPEHIKISPPDGTVGLPGEVISESFFGAEVVLEITTGLGTLKVRESVRPDSLGRVGQAVRLVIDPDYVRVFELD
jgi:ABC-type Fe3+/spermidine/putrescine transport system ATPase subunit